MYSSALTEVEQILSDGRSHDSFARCESASLRLEKFVHIGDNSKKDEIAAAVSQLSQKVPVFSPPKAVRFVAKLGGRLIVNQAGGILENAGLCLHPHFNAPYIPGSALKGVARHAAWRSWNEEKDDARKTELAKEIAEIFGYPTGNKSLDDYLAAMGCNERRSGSVCFMPAFPETTAKLVVDIVNCHHPKYYSGDDKFSDAADVEPPVPNFFPAVEKDCQFVFTLVPLRGGNVERAKSLLIEALTVNGVGAKTAAGYGWFVYDEEAEKAREEARAKAEEKKRLAAEKAAAEQAEAEKAAAARAARQALPILEQWSGDGGAAAVCGKAGKSFASKWSHATDEERAIVVKALQAAEGLGHDVWVMLRTDKKRKNQAAADAVFKFAKEHSLGRMPQ